MTAAMDKLLELALRCEQASGADPQLDAEIWCAVFAPPDSYVEHSRFNGAWCIYNGTSQRTKQPRLWEESNSQVRPVTSSLDAAMMLVPAPVRWPWNVTMATAYGSASVIPCHGGSYGIHDPCAGHCNGAATPALALTAASLRAIASQKNQGG